MSQGPIIRYATEKDVGSILYLIKELAIFENALDAVEATEEHLLSTLSFPKSGNATELADFTPGFSRTLLLIVPPASDSSAAPAQQAGNESNSNSNSNADVDANANGPVAPDGAVAGMALFFNNYSTWRGAPGIYLEDLYVRPQFRRQGHARLLLRALGKETLRLGGKRLEWSCLRWNENALKFYASLGAQRQDEWVGLRVEGAALEELGGGGAGD